MIERISQGATKMKRVMIGSMMIVAMSLASGLAGDEPKPLPKTPVEPPSETAKVSPLELKMVRWGSSSSGMLQSSMEKLLGDQLKITYKPSGVWFRADWMSKDIEAGETEKYEKIIEKARTFSKKAGTYDYGMIQINGAILSSADSEKHVIRILDDMCEMIKSSGATPLIFEHWTSRSSEKMRHYCFHAARKHGAKVAFCGSASAEVIAEKGKKYIGAGDGHTNSRGLYLWSCCMYATLTGKSPIGLPVPVGKAPVAIPVPTDDDAKKRNAEEKNNPVGVVVVTKEDAEYLQRKAWEAHQKYTKLLEDGTK